MNNSASGATSHQHRGTWLLAISTVTVWNGDTDENGRLVEQWSETNQLSLVHGAKQPKSFNSKRWQQGYNPDFVSYSIAHLAEKDVMDAIPKTQHRPISIKLNASIRPRNVLFEDGTT